MIVWPEIRLKYLARINERTLPEDTAPDLEFRYIDIGTVGRGNLVAEPEDTNFSAAPSRARRLLRDGDTIVSTVRTYLRAIWPVPTDAKDMVASTGFAVLSPGSELEPRFLAWWAQSDVCVEEIVARSVGVSYPAINPSGIGNLTLALPPRSKQERIADFLDAETTRIDALIEKKERMIALLGRRLRTTIVSEIFLGMQPTARSGKLARLVDLLPGYTFASQSFQSEPEGAVRLLRGVNVTPTGVRWDDTVYLAEDEAQVMTRFALRPADLVIGMDRPLVGTGMRVAVITEGDVPSLLVQRVARLRAKDGADVDYVRFALQSEAFVAYFEPIVTGVSVPHISPEQILAFRLPLPTLPVQRELSGKLREREQQVKMISARLTRQIDLLREHRQALITAAVSGELELSGAA